MSKPKIDPKANVPLELIKELLTPSEWRMIKSRFLIAQGLAEGLSIRAIAKKVGVGTDTVVRTARKFERSLEIKKHFSGESPKSAAKWVFGQVKSEEE